MMRTLFVIAAVFSLAASPVSAQSWRNSFTADEARDARRKGDIVPLSQIFRQLENRYGGYQVDAQLFSTGDGSSEYRIIWMTEDGRRMRIVVDAQTGRVKSARGA